MDVLVTGGAGMIGRKLAERLAREGTLGGESISRLTIADVVRPDGLPEAPFRIDTVVADVADASATAELVAGRPDVVFHLAAVVSGEAEADFEKGFRANLDGTRNLLDAIRAAGPRYRPRFVFASSIAVFGGPFPETIPDDYPLTPLTSYGTQKAICELLLADYSRRRFVDGVGLRLPTISVRPGAPNRAASGFFSSIVREPLNGREAILPVPASVRHWHASPRSAVGFLLHAATMDTSLLGSRRSLTMPGVSVTVAEQIEALRRVGGDEAVRLIRREPDKQVMRMVAGWPERFAATRARELGFEAEEDFDRIVRAYVEDELR